MPFSVHELSSSTQVDDWVISSEWNVRDAYVLNAQGQRVIDFQRSNLHLPFAGELSLEELNEHLYSLL